MKSQITGNLESMSALGELSGTGFLVSRRDRVRTLFPPGPLKIPVIRRNDGPLIFLLHGLMRGASAMEVMAKRLHQKGFTSINLPYASYVCDQVRLARALAEQVNRFAAAGEFSFVTHSMGGILVRRMINLGLIATPKRMLMLAPPNQGSEIVRQFEARSIDRLLGASGCQLHPDRIADELADCAPPGVKVAIVAGLRASIPVFQSVFHGPNDGIVSVEETRLNGAKLWTVHNDHTWITTDPLVLKFANQFMRGEIF